VRRGRHGFHSADSQQIVLVRADDAEVLGLGTNTIQLLADGGSDGRISAARTKMAKGIDGPPPHHHKSAPEVFFIIEGALHVLTGQQVVTIGEGDYLLVPPHMPHAFATPEDRGVDMLFIMAGIERFEYFRLGARVLKGQAGLEEILESQDRFDNHFEDSPVWREFRNTGTGGEPD
jgi:mannose-6-phosphate isomerase-like protein (cupin superfamily)